MFSLKVRGCLRVRRYAVQFNIYMSRVKEQYFNFPLYSKHCVP